MLGTVRLPWCFISALFDCYEPDEAEDRAPPQVAKLRTGGIHAMIKMKNSYSMLYAHLHH